LGQLYNIVAGWKLYIFKLIFVITTVRGVNAQLSQGYQTS
jgi:hypothetical protein